MRNLVSSFFLRALLFLIPALAVWYLLRHGVVWLPAHLSGELLAALFPFWVRDYELHGTVLSLVSSIQVRQSGRVADLIFEVDVLAYCYGLPLLAAFFLASNARRLVAKLALGALILIPLQVWGACFHLLMQVSAHGGAVAQWRTGFSAFHLNAFGLGYQIGYLLLPTLGPVMLWLWLERRFMVTVMFEAALADETQKVTDQTKP